MSEQTIPLIDLAAEYGEIEAAVAEAVTRVIESRAFVLGPDVSALEKEIAEYSGVRHAIGVASGTDALILLLKALDLRPGDEVITTPFTFFATASSILAAGARPVFVDIDPETCLIDPARIEEAVTHNTKAIIPVHLYGQCAEMKPIMELARSFYLRVIEDACQSVGASYQGTRAGALGEAGALSFYPSKNLGGIGDGGMVLTNDGELAGRVRSLRVYGFYEQGGRWTIGTNSRLDSIQAAALRAKLPLLEGWSKKRAAHAAQYAELLRGSPIKPLAVGPERVHVYNNFVVRAPDRDGLAAYLEEKGIGTRIYYDKPLHKVDCFKPHAPAGGLPEAEKACLECLAIPCYPAMTADMVGEVSRTALSFYG